MAPGAMQLSRMPSGAHSTATALLRPMTPARAAYPRSNPMLRAGTTWDIAEACAYLAGPAAAYVTGELMTVDGGGQLWGETWTTGKPDYFKD